MVLRDQGLHVTAQQVEEPVVAPDADEVRLRLTGDDRPGVVHEISTAISEAGISISRLGTVTDLPGKDGGRGFEITAQLTVPVGVDLDAVLDSIGEVAVRMGIALNVEDLTGDDAGNCRHWRHAGALPEDSSIFILLKCSHYFLARIRGASSCRLVAATFVPDDFEVPLELSTDRFRLEPLGPEHNERDHEAWMSSIDHIRATPGFPDGKWPTEMSAEQNLADLVRHAGTSPPEPGSPTRYSTATR